MPDPNEFDPFVGLTADDTEYLNSHRQAFARQQKAHAHDEERKKAAEAHLRATREAAGLPPDAPLPAPSPSAASVVVPGAPASAAAAIPTPSGRISIVVARPDVKPNELPPSTEKFAPDWGTLKEMIAKFDGTWIVSRHEFPVQVATILGFFGKDGWEKPVDTVKETFEAIVKNGRVFRSDPA
jgi:hypothetical protein